MKIGVVFLSGFIFLTSHTLAQNYPHIEELRGLENSLGNTQLFYRYINPNPYCWSKNIYHFDVVSDIDTFFIADFGSIIYPGGSCEGDYVFDFEFFNSDPTKYFYCGYNLWIDPVALLRRYDGDIQIEGFTLNEIEISAQNDSLIYVSEGPRLFKSTDSGYNFTLLNTTPSIDNSIISLSKNNDSQIYGLNENKLVRSEDDGGSYIIVDDSQWDNDSKLFYDADGNHIYGLSNYYIFSTQSYISNIFVSNDNGNPFTWNSIVSKDIPLKFAFDENQTGEIFYSAGRQIFKSTDYGTTFSLYKNLDRNVTGLYKKSGTNILYASTPLKIYEITPGTIQIIKELSISQEVYDWYPLTIGNKWIYNNYREQFDPPTPKEFIGITVMEITGDTTLSNQKTYFKLKNEFLFWEASIGLIRRESDDGKLYLYLPEDDREIVYEDLLAEVGDTIWVDSIEYKILTSEDPMEIFGIETNGRTIDYQYRFEDYKLANKIGMYFFSFTDFFSYYASELKGCVIDGTVYGDTNVVSVEYVNPKLPIEFSLSQNYPNPFNPFTNIHYAVGKRQYITLKVYDILGNEIATLVNEEKPTGKYEIEFDASSLPSGIYFYQLKSGPFVQTKKMILLK